MRNYNREIIKKITKNSSDLPEANWILVKFPKKKKNIKNYANPVLEIKQEVLDL